MRSLKLCFLLLLCSCVEAHSLETLTIGEKLEYDVTWMGAHVGVGTLEVREKVTRHGREAYHVVAIAQTNDFLSKLYPVHDEIHSFIDADLFCSLEFQKTVSEGHYRADEKIVYDYPSGKGRYQSFENGSTKEFELLGPVHDFLSAFYWFRLQPAKPGDALKTIVNDDEKNWNLEFRVLRREKKELRGGRVYETLVVEPRTKLKGVLYKRGRAWVYFTADEKRIPVLIRIQTPFGPVVGVLKES